MGCDQHDLKVESAKARHYPDHGAEGEMWATCRNCDYYVTGTVDLTEE